MKQNQRNGGYHTGCHTGCHKTWSPLHLVLGSAFVVSNCAFFQFQVKSWMKIEVLSCEIWDAMLNSSSQRLTPKAADLQPGAIVSLAKSLKVHFGWWSWDFKVCIFEWSFTPAVGSTHQHFQATPAGHGSSNALIATGRYDSEKNIQGTLSHRPRPWIYSQVYPRQSRSESQVDHLSQWPAAMLWGGRWSAASYEHPRHSVCWQLGSARPVVEPLLCDI